MQTASAGNPVEGVGEVIALTTGLAMTANGGVTVVVPQLLVTCKEINGVPGVLKIMVPGVLEIELVVLPVGKAQA